MGSKKNQGYWHGYKIEPVKVADLVPYENNPRINADAVPAVVASIRSFGFISPIVVDAHNVIVNGHTRRLAAIELGMDVVPCIRPTDLTPKQIRLLRLADNKVSEMSSWDFSALDRELDEIAAMGGDEFDMGAIGFPEIGDDPIGGDDSAPAGGDASAAQGVAAPAPGGATVAGTAGTLPPELAGVSITPSPADKIDIEAPTSMERVIVVYPKERMQEVAALLGLKQIDKVVYNIEELNPRGES